jgi:hypothetical protein
LAEASQVRPLALRQEDYLKKKKKGGGKKYKKKNIKDHIKKKNHNSLLFHSFLFLFLLNNSVLKPLVA